MEKLLEIAATVADQAEVYRLDQVSDTVEFADGKLHDIEASRLSGTSLRVLSGGRCGFAYTRNPADPSDLLENARQSLAGGAEAGYDFPETGDLPSLETFDPAADATTTTEIVDEFARVSAWLGERTDAEIRLWGRHAVEDLRIANTRGTDLRARNSTWMAVCRLVFPGSGSGVARFVQSRRFGPFAQGLVEEVLDLYRAAGRRPTPRSGRMPVLFMPAGMFTFTWRLQAGTSAKSLHEGISPLADRVGERVFSENLTVVDDPRDTAFPTARPFDDEGVACDRFPLFEQGVFRGFVNDLDHASRLGVPPTGHGYRTSPWGYDPVTTPPMPRLRHLSFERGRASFADLVEGMGRGLVVEDVLGAHSGNIPNGDYSIGVGSGYWVENGEIAGRATDTMVAGNVYETLRNVTAVGAERMPVHGGLLPPVLCDDVSVTAGG
jgi:PmbA protein